MLEFLLALSLPVTTVALLFARWEYRQRGRLSVLGLALICLMLLLPNLMLEFATSYQIPGDLLDYVGVFIGVLGLLLCLSSMVFFRSVRKTLCMNAGKLTTVGPYRWSRNPQYLGWFLFLLGFSLNDWSLWCLAGLIVVAVCLHLLILVEEEHLLRTFGEAYARYCRQVPRYFGWHATQT
jgi:protein-S-isoprenylcysteine O-methyltransferase Ste14